MEWRLRQGRGKKPEKVWGQDRYAHQLRIPDDGGFLLADGFPRLCIHRYDKTANGSPLGGPAKGRGIHPRRLIDRRQERTSSSCRRANNTAILGSTAISRTLKVRSPPTPKPRQNLLVIPSSTPVTLLNERTKWSPASATTSPASPPSGADPRRRKKWLPANSSTPAPASYRRRSIFVAEWVGTGRISSCGR